MRSTQPHVRCSGTCTLIIQDDFDMMIKNFQMFTIISLQKCIKTEKNVSLSTYSIVLNFFFFHCCLLNKLMTTKIPYQFITDGFAYEKKVKLRRKKTRSKHLKNCKKIRWQLVKHMQKFTFFVLFFFFFFFIRLKWFSFPLRLKIRFN